MKKLVTCLFLLVCFNLFSVEIHYDWEGTSKMQTLHDLFLDSFLQNYQKLGLTEVELATDDIEKVLNAYWNEELACINNNSIRWIVAKDHDEIVGYASFNMEHSPEEVFVQLICVKPEYQGQGIGKNLLYSIFQVDKKIRKLSLVTRRVNSSAIAFYKSLGFEENTLLDKKTNVDKSLCVQLEKIFSKERIAEMKNLEFKVALDSNAFDSLKAKLSPYYSTTLFQIDTYFEAKEGRLKLREENGDYAYFIHYHRPDIEEAKESNYLFYPVDDVGLFLSVFGNSLKEEIKVKKQRILYLPKPHIRVHLDQVEDLGNFLEIEIILSQEVSLAVAEMEMKALKEELQLENLQKIANGYRELLQQKIER